jgi:hypothetical protein
VEQAPDPAVRDHDDVALDAPDDPVGGGDDASLSCLGQPG